jgi:tetratricopeptide (TPR) repeat protein
VSRIISIVFLAALSVSAQTVRGEVQTDDVVTMADLVVQLQPLSGGVVLRRAYVRADGSFEFHDVPSGSYLVRVLRSPDETLIEQTATIGGGDRILQIRIPKQTREVRSIPEAISVRQLRNPPSKSALRALEKAKHYSTAGDYAKAIAALEEAARLLPESPVVHTNLGFAWATVARFDRAEQEARVAIGLDQHYAKAHYLLGHVLLLQGSKFEEAVENLKLASAEVPKARLILAQFYARQRAYSAQSLLH